MLEALAGVPGPVEAQVRTDVHALGKLDGARARRTRRSRTGWPGRWTWRTARGTVGGRGGSTGAAGGADRGVEGGAGCPSKRRRGRPAGNTSGPASSGANRGSGRGVTTTGRPWVPALELTAKRAGQVADAVAAATCSTPAPRGRTRTRGCWCTGTVILSTPRQQGKTLGTVTLMAHRCLAWARPGGDVCGADPATHARLKLQDDHEPMLRGQRLLRPLQTSSRPTGSSGSSGTTGRCGRSGRRPRSRATGPTLDMGVGGRGVGAHRPTGSTRPGSRPQ